MAKVSLHGCDLSFLKDNPLPEEMRSKPSRRQTAKASHYVISDTMDLMVHPSNGKYYDSKSRFRAETRARGLTEVGNETIRVHPDSA